MRLGPNNSELEPHTSNKQQIATNNLLITHTEIPPHHLAPPPITSAPHTHALPSMVRLITQNLLSCPSKVCSYPANFPLSFQNVETINIVEAEFNEGFLRGFMSRIEWDALRKSAGEVSRPSSPGAGQPSQLGRADSDPSPPSFPPWRLASV